MKPDLSQDQYHRQIGAIYGRRRSQAARERDRSEIGDESHNAPEAGTTTWHPRLPKPPDDFPEQANFALSPEEAGFLVDRIQRSHPNSLLAYLARHCEPVDVDAPWEHPDFARFSPAHRELLRNAKLFSEVMHGAALVYNLALAEMRQWQDKQEEHLAGLEHWLDEIDMDAIRRWSLPDFWSLTEGSAHRITAKTRRFVEHWIAALIRLGGGIAQDDSVRTLIRNRESSLKKGRSRFTNKRAREQWGGSSGLGRLTYRWPTASTFLHDLHNGPRAKGTD